MIRARPSMKRQPSSKHLAHKSRRSHGTFWAFGFRPFFLMAAAMAALWILLWIFQLGGVLTLGGAFGAAGWHAHEMIFGYTVAVIAGFLLTAVRNWTQLPTASGLRLAALVALWAAGRLVMLGAGVVPPIGVALVDLMFLPALAVSLVPALWRVHAWRNFVLVGLVSVLALANLAMHLDALQALAGGGRLGQSLGLGTVVMVMVVIGGRVIPTFTRNALPDLGIRDWVWANRLAVGLTALYLVCVLLPVTSAVMGVVTLAAAAANGIRMIPWRSLGTRGAPILWVLHVGYGWIVIGLTLSGAAALTPWVPSSAGTHALGVGAIGTLTLGMMSRVALGHTGRALVVGSPIVVAYALVTLAGATRVTAAFFPGLFDLLVVAALAWAIAFAIFTGVYWSILMHPHVDGRPDQR